MPKLNVFLSVLILAVIIAGVWLNTVEKLSIDKSKLPELVESNKSFQRWITNIKNKGLTYVDADDFHLLEETELYNTKWVKVYTLEDPSIMDVYAQRLTDHKDLDMIVFSPNEKMYVDFRAIHRDGYEMNEASFYGLLGDKIIDAKLVDCSSLANCYFDRAYFIDDTMVVITEISRNVDKKAEIVDPCSVEQDCEYTFKLHLIDLVNNKKWIYVSDPFNAVLESLIPEL